MSYVRSLTLPGADLTVVLARVRPHDSGKVQEIMDRNGAKLARELRELAEQLRFLESNLTSAGITLRMGEFYVDGEHVETQTLTELKSALDHTRHAVWAVLEALSGQYGQTLAEALQEYRMQPASELLHVLRKQVDAPVRPNTPAARSFFEEVQVVADLALSRNMRTKR